MKTLNWEELVDKATQSMLCFPCLGCKTELQMMYAGSKLGLVGEGGFTKVSTRACRLMKEKRVCNCIGTWQNSNLHGLKNSKNLHNNNINFIMVISHYDNSKL